MKNKLCQTTLRFINEDLPFKVETDALDFAVAVTLNQNSNSVPFYGRTLSLLLKKASSVEKDTYAIIEALQKWKHLLIGKHSNLVTGQHSVSFMLDLKHSSKIKTIKFNDGA